MDYTILPHRLIYNPRFSLKDFGIYDNHPINAPFAESMLKLDFIQGNYAEKNVLRCLNDAYYITTMVLLEEDPRWRMGSYQKIVRANLSIAPDAFELFSLSLVSAYLRALARDLSPLQKAFSDTLYDYVSNHYLLVKYSIDEWMSLKVKLLRKEFAPRFIDKVVFNDLENDCFMWVEYTDEYNERIVRELIYGLGETGEEKFTLLFEIDKDAQEYYDRNSYYQDVVKKMLGKICSELCEKYDRHEDHVIHYDKVDIESNVDSERSNVEDGDAICVYDKDLSHIIESNKILLKDLEEAHKTIEKQSMTITKQKAELERLTTLNEVLTKQNARYDEENPEMDIDEETALSIKECIIFFSSIMDCNLNKEDISQMNLARLISKFTQWPKESIRPQIVDINTERENNAKDHTAFSDGVHQAAVNVCALIENTMTGLKKNPLPYSCKQAVENICKIYKSPGRKIESHEIAEAKKNLKKI